MGWWRPFKGLALCVIVNLELGDVSIKSNGVSKKYLLGSQPLIAIEPVVLDTMRMVIEFAIIESET